MDYPNPSAQDLVDDKERKRLIDDITRIKDVLDSFKYGLNFEEFADEIFKTVNRQTVVMKRLESTMLQIMERMDSLEKKLDEGIELRVSSGSGEVEIAEPDKGVTAEGLSMASRAADEEATDRSRENLKKQASELELKIGRLFERENEFLEMGLNDPASATEYEEKARVAREMRLDLESQLKSIKEELD